MGSNRRVDVRIIHKSSIPRIQYSDEGERRGRREGGKEGKGKGRGPRCSNVFEGSGNILHIDHIVTSVADRRDVDTWYLLLRIGKNIAII